MTAALFSRTGDPVGRHGRKTRDALLDAAAEHLQHTTWRDASIPRIASSIGKSSAAFYLYFPNLEAAFRALVTRERLAGRALPPHLEAIRALIIVESCRARPAAGR